MKEYSISEMLDQMNEQATIDHKKFQLEQTLNIEYPGRDLDSAYDEACNRMQKASDLQDHLQDEMNRLRYELDHAERDFNEAQNAAQLFHAALNEEE